MRTTKLIVTAMLAAGLWGGRAWGATIESAGTGMWTNGATWTGGVAPGINDEAVITNGCTVTMNDMVTRSVSNLTIQAGGVLNHAGPAASESAKVILSIVKNLTVDGSINVDGKGYSLNSSPDGTKAGGGSHGGRGVYQSNGSMSGRTYGSITAPINCGGGGAGAAGGGAVRLQVGGTAAVNGTITAVGGSSQHYTGAGGSVFLTAASLSGSGTICANAGNPWGGYGGGGGRIALVATNDTGFGSIKLEAYGSSGGAGGTIYLERLGHTAGQGKLIVDYGSVVPWTFDTVNWNVTLYTTLQNGMDESAYAFSEIVLTNGAVYALDTNDTLNITGTAVHGSPVNRNEGIYLVGGTLTVPSPFAFTNYFVGIGHTDSTFGPSSLTVGPGATLRCDVPYTVSYPVTVATGGVIDHTANGSTEPYKLDLTVNGDLDIQSGGAIDVIGRGYSAANGPGGGDRRGGTYGGRGARYDTSYTFLPTYGSITAPTNCGSGGAGTSGGGAVRLRVSGATTVNGAISADGAYSSAYYSGAGGSVWLTTGELFGSGTIRANGGNCFYGYTGSGGRLAVILTNSPSLDGVKLQAYTSANTPRGAAGTVYIEIPGQTPGRGTLTVDAGNITASEPAVTTFIGVEVAESAAGTFIITNAAQLGLGNKVFTVYGNWENTATFTGDVNSTVVFAGTNAATIYGVNTFYDLTSTNLNCTQESEAKPLYFQEARTNTVNGVLTLTGVRVDSIWGVSTWGLKANPALTHSVSNVWAGRSDASSGSQITAYDSSNMSGNVNWVFRKSGLATNTWLGAVSTAWNVGGNWSEGRPTDETDEVVIPTNSYGKYPVLDVTRRVKSLAISNGAAMSLIGFNLTVDNNLTVAGTLTAAGSETVTVRGNLDFSGGTFNAAASTVWVVGSNAQTVASGAIAFYGLTITNSAAAVTFSGAVTATNIVNLGTPVTFGGAVTAASSFRSQGANVTFGGAVATPSFDNRNGGLVFGSTLEATSFYSANSALVFSGAVAAVTFTNWAGDATFRDDVTAAALYCAPGGMNLTFRDGKTVTVGTLELYGRGGYPIVLRSASDGIAWNLAVTNSATVRQVDVKNSNAQPGLTIYPVAAVNSGGNTNWVFSGPWQTWMGSVSSAFTNGSNWTPEGAPDGSTCVLIEGYAATAPVLTGAATVQCVVVGSVTTGTLNVNGHLTILGDVDVLSNGTITHSAGTLRLTVGSNLTVHGAIDVSGKGNAAGPAGSGSHGGRGAFHFGGGPSALPYGSITAPTNYGGGGAGTAGGGAIRLNVAGTTTVHGVISADGAYSSGYYSGAGGSVWLKTGELAGNGTIRANGGGCYYGYTGAGGRLAVILTNATSFAGVKLRAYTGAGSEPRGASGTIYTEVLGQAPGRGILLLDANNIAPQSADVTTLINNLVTDTAVGAVIITNQAILRIDNNQSLTVNGDWLNTATFIGTNTGATVDFAGAAAATVTANNTFFNLTCTNAGKALSFEAGKTNTVTGLLKLGVMGSQPLVTLQSTVPGSWAYLTLTPAGTQQIGKVSVKDSNASGGQLLVAGGGSENGGHNENWLFPPRGTVFVVR